MLLICVLQYTQTWRVKALLVHLLAQRKSGVCKWLKDQVKLYKLVGVKIPYEEQLFLLVIRVSKTMLSLEIQLHMIRRSIVSIHQVPSSGWGQKWIQPLKDVSATTVSRGKVRNSSCITENWKRSFLSTQKQGVILNQNFNEDLLSS